jgi:hypothetical protein
MPFKADFFALGKLACENECVDILMWLIETEVLAGRAHIVQDVFLLAHIAVREGYVFVLKWLDQYSLLLQCDMLILRAIEHHQVESLLFLLSHGGSPTVAALSYALRQAGERDDWKVYDCLVKWLLLMDKFPKDSERITTAARYGLPRLQHMHTLGVSLCSSLFDFAAGRNDVEMIKWLFTVGCPWSVDTLELVRKKHWDVIESLCRTEWSSVESNTLCKPGPYLEISLRDFPDRELCVLTVICKHAAFYGQTVWREAFL